MIMNIFGLIALGMIIAFLYFLFTDVIGTKFNMEKMVKILIFIIAIVSLLSIPRIYFLIKKKPKTEDGNYALEDIKG